MSSERGPWWLINDTIRQQPGTAPNSGPGRAKSRGQAAGPDDADLGGSGGLGEAWTAGGISATKAPIIGGFWGAGYKFSCWRPCSGRCECCQPRGGPERLRAAGFPPCRQLPSPGTARSHLRLPAEACARPGRSGGSSEPRDCTFRVCPVPQGSLVTLPFSRHRDPLLKDSLHPPGPRTGPPR